MFDSEKCCYPKAITGKNFKIQLFMQKFFLFRPIKVICGFSRESVIAITTNIESIEYRRREIDRIGYPEHPRAGTSDDVEAFISLLHRFLGNIFTVKDMKSLWRKVVR